VAEVKLQVHTHAVLWARQGFGVPRFHKREDSWMNSIHNNYLQTSEDVKDSTSSADQPLTINDKTAALLL